jgi:hypothetical protein
MQMFRFDVQAVPCFVLIDPAGEVGSARLCGGARLNHLPPDCRPKLHAGRAVCKSGTPLNAPQMERSLQAMLQRVRRR